MTEQEGPQTAPREGWPSRRFKTWPIAPGWTPAPLERRVGAIGYQKVVGSVQLLFHDPALADVLIGLRDYCFQQGSESNANDRDRAYFQDALAHDLIFFGGDRGHPLIEDLPLDPKIYNALPQMRASHLDLYRVVHRTWTGRLTLESLTREGCQLEARGLRGPAEGERVLARVVEVGRKRALVQPWMVVSEARARGSVDAFADELQATRCLHPELSPESLLTVAGYHLYEEAAGRDLIAALQTRLMPGVDLAPRVITWKVRHPRELLDLGRLEGAQVVDARPDGRPAMVTVTLDARAMRDRALAEALVSIEGREVELIAFISPAHEALVEVIERRLPRTALRSERRLDVNATYRALRHLHVA